MRTATMPKKPMGVSMPPEFADSCRAAAWYIGRGVTLTSILAAGAEEELTRLEKAHGVFPQREGETRRFAGTQHRKEDLRETVVIRMDEDLLERLRNAAVALQTNYSAIVLDGSAKVLARLERQYHDGNPFPSPKKPAV
jgi:uncharacterized protein (DUF4415 family)